MNHLKQITSLFIQLAICGKKTVLHLLCFWVVLYSSQAMTAVVIQYHHIRDSGPAATRTSPGLFRQHLDYLAEHDYQVVPLASLITTLRRGQPLPDKTVAITFDDGYDSIFQQALPELRRRGWPFTVFINTQPIDERWQGFMDWEQIRELQAGGASIANHSERHWHMLRREENESEQAWLARLRSGIERAEARIAAETGQRHRWLAYPYGEYSHAIQSLLREMDYVGLAQASGPLASWSDLTALPRFAFGGSYGGTDGDIADFALKVATRPLPLRRIWVTSETGERLSDPLLPLGSRQPILHLQMNQAAIAAQVNCFASGLGAIVVVRDGHQLQVQAPKPLAVGRTRYNCTAPSGEKGRFYWYSQPFWQRQADGSWYSE